MTVCQGSALGGGSMSRGARWLVAAGVTAVAFAVPTVVCGVWVLHSLVKDAGARWAVASALGAALATLAVLWGQGFASGSGGTTGTVEARGGRSVAVRGPVTGNITTGDTGVGLPGTPPAAPAAQPSVPPGSVVASGERAVALGDGLEGDIDTGDRRGGGPRP
jgi:hypothetical protein